MKAIFFSSVFLGNVWRILHPDGATENDLKQPKTEKKTGSMQTDSRRRDQTQEEEEDENGECKETATHTQLQGE